MAEYTATDKLKEVRRELFWRDRLYPGMITRNQLTQKAAKKQIAIMRAIEQDYAAQAEKERLL